MSPSGLSQMRLCIALSQSPQNDCHTCGGIGILQTHPNSTRDQVTAPVAAWASRALHSMRCVGLLMGMMTGRLLCCPISCSTSSVNSFPAPAKPIKTVGFTYPTITHMVNRAKM